MADIFADDSWNCVLLKKKVCIMIQISRKVIPDGPSDNK